MLFRSHYLMNTGICLGCMAVSLVFSDLGVVLELNGIVNANLVAFILPGTPPIAVKTMVVVVMEFLPSAGVCGAIVLPGQRWFHGQRLWSTLTAVFGGLLLVFGLVLVGLEQAGAAP